MEADKDHPKVDEKLARTYRVLALAYMYRAPGVDG